MSDYRIHVAGACGAASGASPRRCPSMPDLHYRCIICKTTAPQAEGQPIDASRFPSWRCRDTAACAARMLAMIAAEAPDAV